MILNWHSLFLKIHVAFFNLEYRVTLLFSHNILFWSSSLYILSNRLFYGYFFNRFLNLSFLINHSTSLICFESKFSQHKTILFVCYLFSVINRFSLLNLTSQCQIFINYDTFYWKIMQSWTFELCMKIKSLFIIILRLFFFILSSFTFHNLCHTILTRQLLPLIASWWALMHNTEKVLSVNITLFDSL